MKEIVIVGAVRTAIGTYGGSLLSFPSYELGGMVIKELGFVSVSDIRTRV